MVEVGQKRLAGESRLRVGLRSLNYTQIMSQKKKEILEILTGDSYNGPNKLLHDRSDVDKNNEDENFGWPQVQHIQDTYELLSPWFTSVGMSTHRAGYHTSHESH